MSQLPDLVIAVGSGNIHKVEEIAAALGGLAAQGGRGLRVTGKQALAPGPDPVEDGDTFAANARIKALAYAARAAGLAPPARPRWILADDSGLTVDALGGAPGVRSARFAGEDATDAANNELLLRRLAGVPDGERGAEFVCALCLAEVPARAGETARVAAAAEGRSRGSILHRHRGAGGFGYDPLFLVPGLEKTFAELDTAEKNELSHRGRALRQLSSLMAELLNDRVEIA